MTTISWSYLRKFTLILMCHLYSISLQVSLYNYFFSIWDPIKDHALYWIAMSLVSFSIEYCCPIPLKRPGQLACRMCHILHLSDCFLLISFGETFLAKILHEWDCASLFASFQEACNGLLSVVTQWSRQLGGVPISLHFPLYK